MRFAKNMNILLLLSFVLMNGVLASELSSTQCACASGLVIIYNVNDASEAAVCDDSKFTLSCPQPICPDPICNLNCNCDIKEDRFAELMDNFFRFKMANETRTILYNISNPKMQPPSVSTPIDIPQFPYGNDIAMDSGFIDHQSADKTKRGFDSSIYTNDYSGVTYEFMSMKNTLLKPIIATLPSGVKVKYGSLDTIDLELNKFINELTSQAIEEAVKIFKLLHPRVNVTILSVNRLITIYHHQRPLLNEVTRASCLKSFILMLNHELFIMQANDLKKTLKIEFCTVNPEVCQGHNRMKRSLSDMNELAKISDSYLTSNAVVNGDDLNILLEGEMRSNSVNNYYKTEEIIKTLFSFSCPMNKKQRKVAEEKGNVKLGIFYNYNSRTKEFCFDVIFCDGDQQVISISKELTVTCQAGKSPTSLIDIESIELSDIFFPIKHGMKLSSFMYPDVCSIGSSVIKKCSSTIVEVRTIKMLFTDAGWISINPKIPTFYDPAYNHRLAYTCNATMTTACNGDDKWVSIWGKSDSDCYCQYNEGINILSVVINGIQINTNAIISMSVPMNVEDRAISEVDETAEICPGCSIKCLDGKITYDISSNLNQMKVCHNLICESYNLKSENGLVYLRSLKYKDGFLAVRGFNDGKLISRTSVVCQITDYCNLIHCDFCFENVLNPHCYTFSSYVMWVFIGSVFIMIVILIQKFMLAMKWVIISVYTIVSWCTYPFALLTKVLYKASVKKVSKKYEQLKQKDDVVIDLKEEIKNKPARLHRQKPTFFKPRQVFSFNTMLIIFVLFIIPSVLMCSDVAMITGTSVSCQESDSNIQCTLKYSSYLSLSPVGQESCLVVMENEKAIVSIRIKTQKMKLACKKKILYYTYNPSIEPKSIYSCVGTSGCSQDECTKQNFSLFPKLIKNLFTKNSGKQGCLTFDSNWFEHSCAFNSGCAYYFIGLENKDKVAYEVFFCPEWEWIIEVEVSTVTGSIEDKQSYKLIPGLRIQSNIGDIQLSSVSIPPSPYLNTCFMKRSDGKLSTADCNIDDSFSSGKIGEIRCKSEIDAIQANGKCQFNANIVDASLSGSGLSFASNYILVNNVFNSNLLPRVIGSSTLINDGGDPINVINQGALFGMTISSDSLKINILNSESKCKSKFESLHGCYSCDSGAVITAMIEVTNGDGLATIICSKFVSTMKVSRGRNHYNFTFSFSKPNLDEVCQLKCDSSTEDIHILGDLYFLPPSFMQSTNVSRDSVIEVASRWGILDFHWSDWFKISGSILLSIIIIVILMIIITRVVLPLFRLIKFPSRRYKVRNKSYSKEI